jgi:hypothetical protein
MAGPTINITEPVGFAGITHVRCANPGGANPTGSICACGTASKDGASLSRVWAAVIPLGTPINPTHIPTATPCTNINPYLGTWRFVGANVVVNVPCAAGPLTANTATFVVWCAFADAPATEFPKPQDIAALCSNHTNCDGSGPSPCDGVLLQLGKTLTASVETAPRQYQVQAQEQSPGTSGPLASLVNTTWLLSLRSTGCVWDNGGDGAGRPLVELACDGVVATQWRLTLALNGDRIEYTCPASEWNALGVNRLARSNGQGRGLPDTLTVTPV